MFIWITQIIILSFILIFLVHHLIEFFKSTLTVPKIKDLVNSPSQKYESIYNIISNQSNPNYHNVNNVNANDLTGINSINELVVGVKTCEDEKDTNEMKSQLKNFLKKQLNTNNSSSINNLPSSGLIMDQQTTNISYLDSMNPQGYSSY
jgi:hypothetical protein